MIDGPWWAREVIRTNRMLRTVYLTPPRFRARHQYTQSGVGGHLVQCSDLGDAVQADGIAIRGYVDASVRSWSLLSATRPTIGAPSGVPPRRIAM